MIEEFAQLGQGIYALESGYGRPRQDAIHFVEHHGRIALIESGTVFSVPRVLLALEILGFSVSAVDWVLLTHVHLDHAGGAGALLEVLPQAKLAVHPRGMRHMIDPAKLWASTVAVYGEQFAQKAYGELRACPEDRVVAAEDGVCIDLAGRFLEVMETPGHAKHHVCYFDVMTNAWFTGDAFGLSYRETHVGNRAFVFPTTTPIQFDPTEFHTSIERLCARAPDCMYLTHYSRVDDVPRLAANLHRLIDESVAVAMLGRDMEGDAQRQAIRLGLESLLCREAEMQAWKVRGDAAVSLYAGDLDLNAQGLQAWLNA